ncbi:MAG TPA: molecular chaperone DnaJ [Deinococcales bacterium]|nr:molecular chaperone DnaJ [Deinococcales bacterium]
MTDYYEVLGIGRGADADEIKRAYRALALKYHPDRNPGDKPAEEKFKEINNAYATLSDPERRAHYDQYGSEPSGSDPFAGGNPFGGDLFDLFNSVFGGEGFMGGMGANPRARNRAQAGEDLQVETTITLEQARAGADLQIDVDRFATCEHCHGTRAEPGGKGLVTCPTCLGAGQIRQQQRTFLGNFVTMAPCPQCHGAGELNPEPCVECHGRGRKISHDKVTVTLPKGIDGGYRLRVAGNGNAGLNGGPNGDLYVFLEMQPHPHLERENEHLHTNLQVGLAQAALGGKFEVPSLDGPVPLDVPAGTQHGDTLRLKGKGMPRLQGRGEGDLIVTVNLKVPKKLSKRAQELLTEYARETGETLTPIEDKGLIGKIGRAIRGQ